jgi:glycosyltransferase involved in cell wall biosynthesis
MINNKEKQGLVFGSNIRYVSLKFLVLFFCAFLLCLATLVTALFFTLVWGARSAVRIFSSTKNEGKHEFEMVCVSHVPWDGVWQRNQQTMSRMSEKEKVVYVRAANALEIAANPRHLTSYFGRKITEDLVVVSPVILWGDTRFGLVRKFNRWILLSFIRFGMLRAGFTRLPLILWFYFPRSWYICGGLGESLVVYDIQDEYLTWTNATRDIGIREENLLKRSHIVFTGTNSLCRKKRKYNENIHFIQNGVESEHFAVALKEETEVPEDIRDVPHPVIGYFGLIGDRIDCNILENLADKHPDWSIVLIGPVREEMCSVPMRKNIICTGQREYETLPGYLKGFDVAVIPYLLNETTMDLNPTKLLEYMAGGRPVISTAMTDVVELFSDHVSVASSVEEFLELTEKAAEDPDEEMVRNGIEFALGFTWEAMTDRMRAMLLETLDSEIKRNK